jgi:hypothetical protein
MKLAGNEIREVGAGAFYMRLELNYRLTSADILLIAWGPARRYAVPIGIVVLLHVIVLSLAGSYLGIILLLSLGFTGWSMVQTRLHVSTQIDDEGISVGWRQEIGPGPYMHRVNVRWSSVAACGSVVEAGQYFRIHSAYDPIFLPKRAFSNEADVVAFRQLVADKVGRRETPRYRLQFSLGRMLISAGMLAFGMSLFPLLGSWMDPASSTFHPLGVGTIFGAIVGSAGGVMLGGTYGYAAGASFGTIAGCLLVVFGGLVWGLL